MSMRMILEKLIRTAGQQLLSGEGRAVTEKEGIGNYVTELDKRLQEQLRDDLSKLLPEAGFQGEEGGSCQTSGLRWIVDPIDGTTNFVRGLRYSCVSVALAEDDTPLMGVVYNPYADQCYSGEKGKGAWCNGQPIHVSERELSRSLLGVGITAYEREETERMFRLFQNLFAHCEDLRSFGSAALDLCAVGAGTLDVYVELQLQPWDYAAASCIITEAGGVISDLKGNPLPFHTGSGVLAADKAAYEEALAVCLKSL